MQLNGSLRLERNVEPRAEGCEGALRMMAMPSILITETVT